MIPPAYPCVASRYVKKVIKICEWVKTEKSALNLLCIALGLLHYTVQFRVNWSFRPIFLCTTTNNNKNK